jgi:hypothetical protein
LDLAVDFIPDFVSRGILIGCINDRRESQKQPYSMCDLAVKLESRLTNCAHPKRPRAKPLALLYGAAVGLPSEKNPALQIVRQFRIQ